MSQQESLADKFIRTVSQIHRMRLETPSDHPMRHATRRQLDAAERVIDQSLSAAQEIAFAARDAQREFDKAAPQHGGTDL